jgi:hypothetical protein
MSDPLQIAYAWSQSAIEVHRDQRARTELLINFHEKFFDGILVAVPRTRNLGTGYSEKLLADLSFKVAARG